MRYLFILMAFFLLECSDNSKNQVAKDIAGYDLNVEEDMEIEPPRTSASLPPASASEEITDDELKIIKKGDISMEANDIRKTKRKLDIILKKFKGYYEKENLIKYPYRIQYELKMRVPVKYFDSLIIAIESGSDKINSKNITASDVTKEFIDTKIRLENKLAYLDQYKELLKKANTIKEILEVQEIIRNLESEIESKKGRLKYLQDRVSFSTLNITLNEYKKVNKTNNKFFSRLYKGLQSGFDLLLNFIVVIITLWPVLLIIVIIWFTRKRIFKKFKH